MKPFDISTCPLSGVYLIEASAGTGKTYALAGLYLRFLVEKKLSARRLLVITYTKAATAELKSRIRQMIAEAKNAFLKGETKNRIIQDLLDRYPEPPKRRRIARELATELTNFDETSIFTIHGFCRRILTDQAFASGEVFEAELIENQRVLEREFVEDFWRKNFYETDPVIVQHVLHRKMNPEQFASLLKMAQIGPEVNILPDIDPLSVSEIQNRIDGWQSHMRDFINLWGEEKKAVETALRDPALNKVSFGKKVDGIIRDVEELTKARDLIWPPPACMEKLSATFIRAKTKNNQTAPAHPLFDLAEAALKSSQALLPILDQYLIAVKKAFFLAAQNEFPRRKKKQNLLYFDDLLLNVYETLQKEGSITLATMMRQQYGAVLVDEFQDTDPLQFAVLHKVFAQSPKTDDKALYYIGDPKQAIYSFRGADIYAYLQAAKTVDESYTMAYNWRSEAPLIQAVNVLFGKTDRPFVHEQIRYGGVEPAPDAAIEQLRIEGRDAGLLQWWFVPGTEDGKPLGRTEAHAVINRAVVAEVANLIRLGREGKAQIGQRPLSESDIAILVRRNAEAAVFQKLLRDAGIPSVLYSAESVFASDEVTDLRQFLQGVIHNDHEGYLLAALATPFFSWPAEEIAACLDTDACLEKQHVEFRRFAEIWQNKGILTLVNTLFEKDGVRRRIASYPDGERRLTNYRHLADLLSQAQNGNHLTPSDLLQWLERMSVTPDNRKEEQLLRLETDRAGVRIVTVHKSKGLEYPVCFCPYAWVATEPKNNDGPLRFHDEKNDWRTIIDLGSEQYAEHQAIGEREILAENCRLLYVSLTRAKNRCYFISGNIDSGRTSAVNYLFHKPEGTAADGSGGNERMLEQMKTLAGWAPGNIQVRAIAPSGAIEKLNRPEETEEMIWRPFSGKIEQRRKIASYTYLTRDKSTDSDWDEFATDERFFATSAEDGNHESLRSFPPGATSGILLHEILEKLDFTRLAEENTQDEIRKTLEKFNYPADWQTAVFNMLQDLTHTNLKDDAGRLFSLSQIGPEHCLKEMEFYYPLKSVSSGLLMDLLQRADASLPTRDDRTLHFPAVSGFLKGYIDLVFTYEGRYYLADWKSNYLGDCQEDYAPALLKREMRKAFYDVQYLIYTVALDQYLKKRKPDYDYDAHFGGAYYFFLRGLAAGAPEPSGIYYTRPDKSFVTDLEKALLADIRT